MHFSSFFFQKHKNDTGNSENLTKFNPKKKSESANNPKKTVNGKLCETKWQQFTFTTLLVTI